MGRRWPDRHVVLLGAVAGTILIVSVMPVRTDGSGGWWAWNHADTVVHLIAYGALGSSIVLARPARRRAGLAGLLVLVGIVTLYGAGIELLQIVVPTRHCSLSDALANGVGALLGVGLTSRVYPDGRRD